MTAPRILDPEAAAVNEFKREGAFLLLAELEASRLEQLATANNETVVITAAQCTRLARMFARAVAIAKDYHMGAAEII